MVWVVLDKSHNLGYCPFANMAVAFLYFILNLKAPVLFLESLILLEGDCFFFRYLDWRKLFHQITECAPIYVIFTLQLWRLSSSGIIQIHDLLFEFQSVGFLVFRHVEPLLCSFIL